jgi:hypothetical protein
MLARIIMYPVLCITNKDTSKCIINSGAVFTALLL